VNFVSSALTPKQAIARMRPSIVTSTTAQDAASDSTNRHVRRGSLMS